MIFYRIRKINGRYYMVKEWWDDRSKKKRSKLIGPCEKDRAGHENL